MARRFLVGVTVLVALTAARAGAQQPAGGRVRAAIDARNAEWTTAFNRGDVQGVLKIYDAAATIIPAESEPLRSRAEFEALLRDALKSYKSMKFQTISLSVHGSYAYETGRSTYRIVGDGGKVSPGADNYLVVWHKGTDGVWYYHVDIWWPAH